MSDLCNVSSPCIDYRRCTACQRVSYGLLPAVCMYCLAPLVRAVFGPTIAPRDGRGEPIPMEIPLDGSAVKE
jgi:hypothetical protein